MQATGKGQFDPALKQLVVEASQALARLDADRLEELAKSCEALTRGLKHGDDQEFASALVTSFREAAGEMDIFARVLEATRENAQVMRRLLELREGRLEYGADKRLGQGHGDN